MPDTDQAGQKGQNFILDENESGALSDETSDKTRTNSPPSDAPLNVTPLIVAIGASAGGLAAFKQFFTGMPADTGIAFVLVQHLDPHYQSMLVDILARDIKMPVTEAQDGTLAEPGIIYVIPPDATLTISRGILRVVQPAPPRLHRWPIDTFFGSLAEDQGENAVGIVLSGVGSDGAAGITAIKGHGGLTLAQSEFDHVAMEGMPENATATGFIDFVLPIEEMPARIAQHQEHLRRMAAGAGDDGTALDAAEALPAIITLLHARLGHDFSQYKTSTVIRRIQRRMAVLGCGSMVDFTDRLRHDPVQVELLFRELLIGVTQFMRDPDAFAALAASGLPVILNSLPETGQLRVWVPGCSTGEEVYSLAILLRETAEQAGVSPKIQIFGTDIDEAAIATARAALYPPMMKGLPAAHIARWFTNDGECYRVNKTIREMCVFSVHNLIKDPPFSRLHLISCRNLLIYMNSDLQERVIRIFHYALQPNGILLLGPSEGISRSAGLFRTLDRRHRLYQRRLGDPPASPEDYKPVLPPELHAGHGTPHPERTGRQITSALDDRIDRNARAALERHSPAYIVVNDQYDIIRFSGGEAGRFLEPAGGAANLGLFSNLRKSLRPTVRTALQSAFISRQPVVQEHVPIEIDGQLRTVCVIIEPITDPLTNNHLCVVAFRDLQRVKRRRGAKGESEVGAAALQALEAELLTTKARMQIALEAAETANEETRSSVEEYQSVNEELQSSNEELETAKEEMQSINEELQTINTELSVKNDQLTRLNNDVQNLLESTQIATIFLDPDLRIKGFTPPMKALFSLRASDHGRPLSDIAARLDHGGLWTDIRQVLRDHAPVEREIRLAGARTTFIMRIMPYNTGESSTDGVVLTFVDITAQKQTEQELRDQAAIIEYAHDAFLGIGFDGIIRSWNPAAERLFGYRAAEAVGQPVAMLCPPERMEEQAALMKAAREGAVGGLLETVRQRKDGSAVEIELTIVPIPDESGKPVAFASASRDIAARRRADRHRTLLLHELSHRVKNALATVQSMAVQTLRHAKSLDDFSNVFLARLIALAGTHDLLTGAEWQGAPLRDVIEAELRPYQPEDRGRWKVSGPHVKLNPKAALAIGMAVHELATNAVKYGSLSVASGRLDINWEERVAGDEHRLHVIWAERDGPPVVKPQRQGFGSRLIADGLAYELDGSVEMMFEREGVCCVIDVPLTAIEDMT
jgi:two-component system CheB/CheR fusion protein